MNSEIKLNTFLKEKLNNFILYLEKTISKNNELYPQVITLKDNEVGLIKYAEFVSKVAKVHTNDKCSSSSCEKIHKTGIYFFEEATIIDYLTSQLSAFKKKDLEELDGGMFITKIQRYLEMFVNTICTS